MAPRPRRVDFTPDDFFISDERPVDVAIVRAVSVRAGKLSRGAYKRIQEGPDLEAEVRAEKIANRADRTTGARIADERRQERLARKLLAQGKVDSGVVSATDYKSYVQRLMRDMYGAADFEKRQLAARDFFSLLGMARLPGTLEEQLTKAIYGLSAPELLQLTRCYAAANVDDVLPPRSFVNALYREADPAVLMPVETTMEVLSILSRRGQRLVSQTSFFEGMSGYTKQIADHLLVYKNTYGKEAPAEWARPGDILVFCCAMTGNSQQAPLSRRRRVRQQHGVRRATLSDIPAFDRPDIKPVAMKAMDDVHLLAQSFPSHPQLRRFRCIRRTAIVALKKAQIVNEESPAVVVPAPKPRRVLRKRAARQELAERRQP